MAGAKVGLRAFARELGVTHQAVLKAIKSGRLKSAATRRGKLYEIDVELGKAEWTANTDARRQRENVRRKAYNGPGPLYDPAGAKAAEAAAKSQAEPGGPTLTQARVLRETYLARLARLEFEEKNGGLVAVEAVRRERFQSGKAVRDAILSLPPQLAPELLGRTVQELTAQLTAAGVKFDFSLEELLRVLQLLLEERLTEALEVMARGRLDGTTPAAG